MSTAPPADVVHAASHAWVWVPPDAIDVTTDDYRFTVYENRCSVQWSRTARPFGDVLAEVVARTAASGRPTLRWWVHADTEPADTDRRLAAAGFEHVETVDVLALDLRDGAGPLVERLQVPPDVDTRPSDTLADLELGAAVDAEVFDWPPASKAVLDHELALAQEGLSTGRWTSRQYLALVDGEVRGHGGVGLAPGGLPRDGLGEGLVARLWGGAVLPDARGRGAYRALLAARCAFAVEQGATLALVKGRVATSAPVLRRAGFTAYGQERCYAREV